jgi:hypothetical protein
MLGLGTYYNWADNESRVLIKLGSAGFPLASTHPLAVLVYSSLPILIVFDGSLAAAAGLAVAGLLAGFWFV